MAIIVEHDKRKREILENSLDVFIEEGYEDATFQKIADKCGITRTTLYLYFKNKREIFLWSIKQLTEGIEEKLRAVLNDSELTCEQKLRKMMANIFEACVENKKLFNILLMYLLQLQKTGKEVSKRVRRRVIRLRHMLSTIIIAGINSGEFKKINVKGLNEVLYGLIESGIFRLAVLNQTTIGELQTATSLVIDTILT